PRRDSRARGAGPQDRQPRARRGPRADDRDQQVGRRRGSLGLVQWRARGPRRRARATQGRAAAGGLGAHPQGARPDAQRRVRAARAVEPARADRRAQPLVRARARSQPAARTRRKADQAALRDPDQDAAAEFRGLRHPAGRPAGELRAVPGERAEEGTGLRRGSGAADVAEPEKPLRQGVSPAGGIAAPRRYLAATCCPAAPSALPTSIFAPTGRARAANPGGALPGATVRPAPLSTTSLAHSVPFSLNHEVWLASRSSARLETCVPSTAVA